MVPLPFICEGHIVAWEIQSSKMILVIYSMILVDNRFFMLFGPNYESLKITKELLEEVQSH
jgi:hypothetical protein